MAPVDWTEEDVERHMKVADNIVVVCPVVEDTVPVEVEVHLNEPPYEAADWDHIVEGQLVTAVGPASRAGMAQSPGRPVWSETM